MLQDYTPGILEELQKGKVTGYIGFDPTAPSLTIGNYVQVMLLKIFQQSGHQPIILMGGATGRIGDPSGKDTERDLKTIEELEKNLAFQKLQFQKLIDFECGGTSAIMVNNFDFYKDMNVLEFMRNVGKNLTINYMMSKESVKTRIETGMSYTEFSYQLLQAYDFLYLYKNYNCNLQMGGSDQWGNITSGTEFIRRMAGGKAYALTTPLLTKADGKKFGKSEEGNIWLDPKLTSPYKFYQYWINADDRDLRKFYRYFSLKNRDEIEILEKDCETDPNRLKKLLAEELTVRIHGHENYQSALKVSELLFNHRLDTNFLKLLTPQQWKNIGNEIPTSQLESELPDLIDLPTFLTEYTSIFRSKSEVWRGIKGNALAVNKIKVNSDNIQQLESGLKSGLWLHDQFMLVENGKKNKFMVLRKKI